jgi:hypothetical protein
MTDTQATLPVNRLQRCADRCTPGSVSERVFNRDGELVTLPVCKDCGCLMRDHGDGQ